MEMKQFPIAREFFADWRVLRLAALAGEGVETTRGRLVQIWMGCYAKLTIELDALDVCVFANLPPDSKYAELLVEANLADALDDGKYRIKGTRTRLEAYMARSANGKALSAASQNSPIKAIRSSKKNILLGKGAEFEEESTQSVETKELKLSSGKEESSRGENLGTDLFGNVVGHVDRRSTQRISPLTPFASDPVLVQFLATVRSEVQQAWVETYGDLEFLTMELKKARSWLLANPHKAPKSQLGRFLNAWLAKAWEHYRKRLPSNRTSEKTPVLVQEHELFKKDF